MGCRLLLPWVVAMFLAGCGVRTVTVTSDQLVASKRQDAVHSLPIAWWYVGSDAEFHYFVRGKADRPTHRVPVDDLPPVKGLAFDPRQPRREPIQEYFPQLEPWRDLPQHPPAAAADPWVDVLRIVPDDEPLFADSPRSPAQD